MGRAKTELVGVIYARVKPRNKAKLYRYIEGMKRHRPKKKKDASVSAVIDKLIEKHIYA